MRPTLALLLFAVGLLIISPAAGAKEQSSIDLSGNWRINDDLSDDPREVMQKKMEEMRRFRRGRSGNYGGGGGGPSRDGMQERFRQIEQGRRYIVIRQEDDEVTMIYASRDTISIVPDGKKHKRQTLAGEVETRAWWRDFTLEVKTKVSGREMTRLYRISNEGHLEIVMLIELPRGNETVEIMTVYDDVGED